MKKHNFLATTGIKTLVNGTKAIVHVDADTIGRAYAGSISDGAAGYDCESAVNYCVTGIYSRYKPQGVTDVTVKKGVTLEVKTGCGWLLSPVYSSKEEAEAILENGGLFMRRAAHVFYLPRYNGPEDVLNGLVLKQSDFLRIFREAGKIRVKKGSNGLYGIAIQQYIPTPTFKASFSKYMAILDAMLNYGEYLDIFCARMDVEIHDIPGVVEW